MKSVEANEAGETMRVKLAAAEAERDALRALLHQSREVEGGAQTRVLDLEAERDALRAEVERLRGLLLGYYRLPSSEWIKSLKVEARASVEVKP